MSAVFLHNLNLHSHLSHGILQDHFTQFGVVLKILYGSCGKCGLVYFASPAVAQRVSSVTHRVWDREMCPLLVEEDTARQFWRSGDGYLCDGCVCFTETEDEDRLFIDEGEEGVKQMDEATCTKAPPERCLQAWMVPQGMQHGRKTLPLHSHLEQSLKKREEASLTLLRHLVEQSLKKKEETSLELLHHLVEQNLKKREEASLTLFRHLEGTLARCDSSLLPGSRGTKTAPPGLKDGVSGFSQESLR